MSTNELVSTIKELRELKALASDLETEITALEDVVKSHMGNQEQLRAGEYKNYIQTRKVCQIGR